MKEITQPTFPLLRAALMALLLALPVSLLAENIAFPGGTYTQTFDGLATNQNSAISNPDGLNGPFPLDDLSWASPQPYVNTGMAGWQIFETGGTAQAAFSVNDGTSSTSFSFSYGSINSTDRALGVLAGSARIMAVGAVFQNTSGSTISELTVNFTGEQWRLGRSGAANPADTFAFGYKVGTETGIDGTFNPFTALDFITPITVGTVGALDGNDPANRTPISSVLTDLNWAPDEYLVLRWIDSNDAGADHGMAIDDFSLVGPPVVPEPTTAAMVALFGAMLLARRAGRSTLG